MTTAMTTVRVRDLKGRVHSLSLMTSSITLKELQTIVRKSISPDATHFGFKAGFPPRLLESDGALQLAIAQKEQLVQVEVEQVEQTDTSAADSATSVGCLKRVVVPADNSCLFSALEFLLDDVKDARSLIADAIASSETLDAAMLGQPNESYVRWLRDTSSWGGEIELNVASEIFAVRIVVVHVGGTRLAYGNASRRIHLIFDGAHYDPLLVNGTKIVHSNDLDADFEESADLMCAKLISLGRVTDLARDQLICGACKSVLKGEAAAQEHARVTGHVNFQID
jgi:ubiquitin thioesterase OTU1